MIETVKPQQQLLLESPLPSREQILDRVKKLYGRIHFPDFFFEPIGAEVERILREVTLQEFAYTEQIEMPIRYYKPGTTIRVGGYRCPKCKGNDIKLHFKHCPGCGTGIRWGEHTKTAYISKAIK